MAKQTIKKWWQVFHGDAEQRFFVGQDGKSGLVRSAYDWRSTDALARESGLSKGETERIISKYHRAGMIVQHGKDPEKWGYWEKVSPQLADAEAKKGVADADKESRIDKVKKA